VLCISLIVITLDNISVARHAPAARPFTDQIIAASESFVGGLHLVALVAAAVTFLGAPQVAAWARSMCHHRKFRVCSRISMRWPTYGTWPAPSHWVSTARTFAAVAAVTVF